jgi:hypothetical protein
MISFFALGSYIGKCHSKNDPNDAARRLSSRIRAEEMSEYLGAMLNPVEGYSNDVRIYVKPRSLDNISDGSYVDFLDGEFRDTRLATRPKIKVIAASECSYEYMKEKLPNEIFFIPSHHINFEKVRRNRKGLTVGGYLGVPSNYAFERYGKIKEELSKIGIDFIISYYFKTRQDALDLYNQIDVFVHGDWENPSINHPYRIPTKIINAASFGIPSIAAPIMGNKEVEGYYLHASSIEEMLSQIERLRDETFYNDFCNKIIEMSDNYHISKVAELYRELV